MTADQNDYALSLSQDELYGLADLIHDHCKCVPQNNGGGDCDWCSVYYATTDLAEEIKACVLSLRDEIKAGDILLKGRKQLLDELPECPMHGPGCVPYAVTAIKELYQTTNGQQSEIKSLKAALEATGNAMNVLGVKELQHKIQQAIEIFNVNPTGPAAGLMHKALTQEGGQ